MFTDIDYYEKNFRPTVSQPFPKAPMEFSHSQLKETLARTKLQLALSVSQRREAEQKAKKYKILLEKLIDHIEDGADWMERKTRKILRGVSRSPTRDDAYQSDSDSPSVLAGSSYDDKSQKSISLERKQPILEMSGPESESESEIKLIGRPVSQCSLSSCE